MSFLNVLLTVMAFGVTHADEAELPWAGFPKDKSCVAYKTTKGMFFVASVEVVGVNCSISFAVEPGQRRLRVMIPVDTFDSGVGKRDAEVSRLLGGDELRPMSFEVAEPAAVLGKPEGDLIGSLEIRGEAHSVSLRRKESSDRSLSFVADTSFSFLGVSVPSVGPAGLIASPRDALTIFGRLSSEDAARIRTELAGSAKPALHQ